MDQKITVHTPLNGSAFRPKLVKNGKVYRFQTEISEQLLVQHLDGLAESVRQGTAESALDIGMRVLIAQRSEATVVHLTDQLDAATQKVADVLGTAGDGHVKHLKTLEATYFGPEGKLTKAIDGFGKEFVRQLDPNGSPAIRALRETMTADLMKPIQKLLKEISEVMNVNADGSAVGILDKKIGELATNLAALTAKVDAAMTLAVAKRRDPAYAGATLEEFYFEIVSPMSNACGDMIDDTRTIAGAIEGCKTGDYVTTLDPNVVAGKTARIASEAKNRSSVTLPKLTTELDVAMRNRLAAVGFGILTNPRAATTPAICIQGGNKVVVMLPGFGTPTCDPELAEVFLRAGYQTARALAIALTLNEKSDLLVDFSSLNASCEEISAVVALFPGAKAAITRIGTAVDNAQETVESIKSKLVTALEKLVAKVEAMGRAPKGNEHA